MQTTTITLRVTAEGIVTGRIGDIEFSARVLEEKSCYGINEGKISRLFFEQDGKPVLCYDRRWLRPVPDQHQQSYNRVVNALEQLVIQ